MLNLADLFRKGYRAQESTTFGKQYIHAFANMLFWFCLSQSNVKYWYFLTEQWGKVYLGIGGSEGSWPATSKVYICLGLTIICPCKIDMSVRSSSNESRFRGGCFFFFPYKNCHKYGLCLVILGQFFACMSLPSSGDQLPQSSLGLTEQGLCQLKGVQKRALTRGGIPRIALYSPYHKQKLKTLFCFK